MSKNQDRYKEDYSHADMEELEELDTASFEKFHPKKKNSKPTSKKKKFEDDIEQEY